MAQPITTSNTLKGAPLIYHDGVWGAFCSSTMTKNTADVICRELGYVTSVEQTCCYSDSTTHEKIWIYDMQCKNTDYKISQCNFIYGLNATSCLSTKRAMLQCSSKQLTNIPFCSHPYWKLPLLNFC